MDVLSTVFFHILHVYILKCFPLLFTVNLVRKILSLLLFGWLWIIIKIDLIWLDCIFNLRVYRAIFVLFKFIWLVSFKLVIFFSEDLLKYVQCLFSGCIIKFFFEWNRTYFPIIRNQVEVSVWLCVNVFLFFPLKINLKT